MKSEKIKWILIAFSTLVLLYPAFYNGFPFVFSDTGTYINSGFENKVPDDRPIFYGLFIRYSSLATSLWLTVFLQSFIVALALYESVCVMLKQSTYQNQIYSIVIILLAAFSGLPYVTSTLLPDIFTPVSLLLFCLLLFKSGTLQKWQTVLLYAVFAFFALTHLSNLMAFSLIVVMMLVNVVWLKKRIPLIVRNSVLCFALWFIIILVNALFGAGFRANKATPVFMTAKMSENGLLGEYLHNEENAKQLKIYPYRDSLPFCAADYVWDANSVLYKTGGWDANLGEYSFILKDMLTTPKYFARFIARGFIDGLQQLTLTAFGEEFIPYGEGSPPAGQVEMRFRGDKHAYYHSRQTNKWLNINFDNAAARQNILIAISLVIIALYLLKNGLNETKGIMCLFILAFIFCNAFSTGAFTMVTARYNSRVIWLIPFVATVIASEYYFNTTKKTSSDYVR